MPETAVRLELLPAPQSVLEIGPRDNPARAVLDRVAPGGRRVFIDLHPEVEESLRSLYPDSEIHIGDVMEVLPTIDGDFDIVIGKNIIDGGRGKLEQGFFVLTRMIFGRLKPDGRFIIEETIGNIGGKLIFNVFEQRLSDQGFRVVQVSDATRFLEPHAWNTTAIQFICQKPE